VIVKIPGWISIEAVRLLGIRRFAAGNWKVSVSWSDSGENGPGWYAWFTAHPDEGSVFVTNAERPVA